MTVVVLEQARKVYKSGTLEFEALKGVSLDIRQGEMVALMGPSGSGKTTLMQIIGLLDRPTSGRYILAGQDVTTLSENERAEVRNQEIGFVFQAFHLLPRLTVLENVALGAHTRGSKGVASAMLRTNSDEERRLFKAMLGRLREQAGELVTDV